MKFIIIIYTTNKLTVVEMEDIRGVRLRKFKLRKIILGVRMHFRHSIPHRYHPHPPHILLLYPKTLCYEKTLFSLQDRAIVTMEDEFLFVFHCNNRTWQTFRSKMTATSSLYIYNM